MEQKQKNNELLWPAWQAMFGYEEMYMQALAWLNECDEVLLVSHMHPDGDAASATTSMSWILDQLEIPHTAINIDPLPKKFQKQYNFSNVLQASITAAPLEKFKYVIFVDCADRERTGDLTAWIDDNANILNVDHHATNKKFGTVNVVDPIAASATEVIFGLFCYLELSLEQEFAYSIYTGMLTDTEGFRYSNTTPRVLRTAATCLETGIPGHVIAEESLGQTTKAHVELLKRALQRLQFSDDGRIAFVSVTVQDMDETNGTFADLEGIVNIPRNAEDVEVGVLFKEMKAGTVKVSLRSGDSMNVSDIAGLFGGGGHKKAAGCTVNGSIEDAINIIIPEITKVLTKVPVNGG